MPSDFPRIDVWSDSEVEQQNLARVVAELWSKGELVAFPTETVYGLGGYGFDVSAIEKIFRAKRRPATHPLILHVSSLEEARAIASDWPEDAERLCARYWPGPLTVVVKKSSRVPVGVTGGGDTVAIRVPAHPVALALLREFGKPVAAPSANRFQSISPTRAAHVASSLGGAVSLIVDGGACDAGIESTIVSFAESTATVLRPGSLSMKEIRECLPEIAYVAARVDLGIHASPGLDARHYAPLAKIVFIPTGGEIPASTERVGLLAHSGTGRAIAWQKRLPSDPAGYARGLYDALHAADAAGVAVLFVEELPKGDDWWAIRDRLLRAATSV